MAFRVSVQRAGYSAVVVPEPSEKAATGLNRLISEATGLFVIFRQ